MRSGFRHLMAWSLSPALVLLLHTTGAAQESGSDLDADFTLTASSEAMGSHESRPSTVAIRTSADIVIDGVPDEEAWMAAPPITDFTQIKPDEGAKVTERTEVRLLYDDLYLYVGGWLYDEGPITTHLGRRDISLSDTDNLIFFLDTFHDHRTAYRFTTNPSAVKRDEIITIGGSNGSGYRYTGTGLGDTSWDPVWDLATSITDEGWFVEMRIPFAQLSYPGGEVQRWGVQVDRRIARDLEHSSWAFTPALELATVARFGHLEGISGIRRAGRLELLPFVAGRAEYAPVPQDDGVAFGDPYTSGHDYFGNVGVDLRYRLNPNLTLNATVNPDFGQVEIDPADLNLTAYETRFDERRPFFVEGDEIFSFGAGGGLGSTVLYTRRIGRAPQGSAPSSAIYSDAPGTTTILGALKLTGKTSSGWSLGMIDAVTSRERARFVLADGESKTASIEPPTNYLAGRVRRDFNRGGTALGILATAVDRDLGEEPQLADRLHSHAYATGFDFRHDFADGGWRISGDAKSSFVTGSPGALLRTQRSSARYFQRPDADHLSLDPDATSLFGYGGKLNLAKTAGAWGGNLVATALSPNLELNDLGYQTNADRLDLNSTFGYRTETLSTHFRSWSAEVEPRATWNYGGDLVDASAGASGAMELINFAQINLGASRTFESTSDRLTRGGPLTRSPGAWNGNASISTDNKKPWAFRVGTSGSHNDDGGWRGSLSTTVTSRPSQKVEIRFSPSFTRSESVAQYVTTVIDPFATNTFGGRYIFGRLDQRTLSLETRVNYTISPTLTFEMFAEPFISSGNYGALKELAAPGRFSFLAYGEDIGTSSLDGAGRYNIDPDGSGPANAFRISDPDFNYHSLLGNAVLRWEWRPGSTMFLVWQQSRVERLTNLAISDSRRIGQFDFEKDARALLGLKPENIFMIKVNYWTNP